MNNKVLTASWMIILLILFSIVNLVLTEGSHQRIVFIIFLLISGLVFFWQVLAKLDTQSRSTHLPYVMLFYGVFILLFQNIILFAFHGILALNQPIFSTSIGFDVEFLLRNFYTGMFYLDLLGYSLLCLYFYLLRPSQGKMLFRYSGLFGSVSFVLFAVLWRGDVGWYDFTSEVSDPSSYVGSPGAIYFLLAQVSLLLVWYSVYRLYKITTEKSSGYLDNQIRGTESISNWCLYLSILLLINSFGTIIFLLTPAIALLARSFAIWVSIKLIFIPMFMVVSQMNIFQQYYRRI